MAKNWLELLRRFAISTGFSLLIVTPYLLEKVVSDGYYAFNIADYFLIPHLESVAALALLIFAVVTVSPRYSLSSRWLLILLCTLLLAFAFRGFFSAAGIPPQLIAAKVHDWISFTVPAGIDAVTFRRAGMLGLVVIILLLLSIFLHDGKSLFRACAFFGWMLGLLTLIRVVPMLATEANFAQARQQAIQQIAPLKPGAKRVVWLIFDELDYDRIFEHRNKNIALNNIDHLRQQSVSADNAVSPAWVTNLSFPALVTGTFVNDAHPVGPARLLLNTTKGNVEWENSDSLFSRLNQEGKRVDIIGYYHPYCSIFPYATPCISMPAYAYHVWWWGIWQGLRIIPGIGQLSRKYKWTNQAYDVSTRLQLEALPTHLSEPTSTLSFIHINIPHLPGGRLHGVTPTAEMEQLPGYEQNLITVDWALGEIVKNLEAQQHERDILLIVSSDHWLRSKLAIGNLTPAQVQYELGKNHSEVHRVPLFIRHFPETTAQTIPQPISTLYTAQLIQDFLDGKLSNHASIAAWWKNKPYIAPIAP